MAAEKNRANPTVTLPHLLPGCEGQGLERAAKVWELGGGVVPRG